MILRRSVILLFFCAVFAMGARADSLKDLSDSFWQWRVLEQPFTGDDIPRIARPTSFSVDWSAATIAAREKKLAEFEQRWKALAPGAESPVAERVDYRLMGSAIARVRWELLVQESWKRDPYFYVDQTLGSVFILLLQPPPFTEARQQEIVARMQRIPATIREAEANLTDIREPFARLAIDGLDHIAERTQQMETALEPQLTAANNEALRAASTPAMAALTQYRDWLTSGIDAGRKDTAIGREGYLYFLRYVALLPYSPEEMLALSREEWRRSVAFEAYQEERLRGSAPAPIFPNAGAQIAAEKSDEEGVRRFLTEQKILTVPPWMQHYRNMLLPGYLVPYADLGQTDDLTGPDRLKENGTSYIRKPGPDLGFFNLSTARDPRPILVHEGIPGHYFQLTLGWADPDPIRRHYYDSAANEGIGFYAEEMMLQAGYFDDNPHTRATIYSFMRLRALRVEVDVKLALGEFTLQQAADYLASTVPMDKKTALEEAASFASTPGQAISYQIGKLQITGLLADAKRAQGVAFSMLKFNDFVWRNGNVPLSLQRWEMLGDRSELTKSELTKSELTKTSH